MDLNLTWDSVPGVNVIYTVEYRVYLSGNSFTVYSTNVTTNHINITGLPRNFYEVRIKANCDATYVYKVAGEDPCQPITVGTYTVTEDTGTYQKILFNFSNILPSGATIKVTNTNTNTVILTQVVASNPGTIIVNLPKIAGQTVSYKVEVANICTTMTWQLVGNFTLVGPPPTILTSFKFSPDFCDAPWNNPSTCSKPNSGPRFIFAEPLPQDVVVTFDFGYGDAPYPFRKEFKWYSETHVGGPVYLQVHIPAGTTTFGKCAWRDGGDYYKVRKVCIVKIEPAVFNNGKVLKFDDAGPCIPIKNIPISDFIDKWGGCLYKT